jgi:competence protein CoiA
LRCNHGLTSNSSATPDLDAKRYTLRLWEKWIHTAYFGRVYYWIKGLTIAAYHFDPNYKSVPKKSWYSESGKKMSGGGYSRKSKRSSHTTQNER